jgi:hypothetical protein
MWRKIQHGVSVAVVGMCLAAPAAAQRRADARMAFVATPSVHRVSVVYDSRGPRPRRYVITGALVGAGLGAIIGGISALTHPCNDSYCLKDESMPIAVAIPGAAIGALAGWVVYRIAKSRYNYARS